MEISRSPYHHVLAVLADAVFTLQHLFLERRAFPHPAWLPGRDPTPDALDCDR